MIWGGRRQYWGKLPGDEGSRFPDSVEKGHRAQGQKEKTVGGKLRNVDENSVGGEEREEEITSPPGNGKAKMQMAKHQDRPMNMIGRASRVDPL